MQAIYSNYYPNFLYVDKYRFSRNWIYTPSEVPYALLRYIVSGHAIFTINGEACEVSPGDVVYIPQGSILSGSAKSEIVFISVRFVGSIQYHESQDLLQSLWHFPRQHNFSDTPEVEKCFEALYTSALTRNTFKMLEIRGYLNLIWAYIAKLSPENYDQDDSLEEDRKNMEATFDMTSIKLRAEKSLKHKHDPRITMIVDYITTHPEENLSRQELCDMAGISVSTLRRLFKEQTGKTLFQFIKENKMTNAARRLLVTDDPISAIAYDLGYEIPSYFSECFKQIFGVSPQEYRRSAHGI
ncbi:MAG: helix-turn-helix domain-containing protein [Butyricicoccus pullicaecorum]|nr:helix-turn-helix domain-containing protein [Butyricicoccus pullicaecorum]